MAQKCVHRGCDKLFSDPDDICTYHPGPPVFHEGQKGWKCCKPRVLTFEEFLSIPPCTEGKHSTTDIPPGVEEKKPEQQQDLAQTFSRLGTSTPPPAPALAPAPAPAQSRAPIAPAQQSTQPQPPAESEDDDPAIAIGDGATCRRKGCNATYKAGASRDGESCVYHPGAPIFHEGSKGYSCCKRRVLEFDEFMRMEGCNTKGRHLFIGSGKSKTNAATGSGGEELLDTVRSDFYQTQASVIASFFLKKIVKDTAKVEFTDRGIVLDLITSDSPPKRFSKTVPLYAEINPEKSTFKVLGTKLEVSLAKAQGVSWPVLRSDDIVTGEIIQVGRAGKLQ